MSVEPDEVAAPADDTIVFHSSPVRTFLVMTGLFMLAYLVVSPLVDLLLGADDDPWWLTLVQAAVISLVVAGAFAFSSRGSLSTWVRVSSAGLELAAQGSDPVFLTWPDIEHVVVRRSGTRTVLEVTPVDLDRVHPVENADVGGPAMDGKAFTADLTQLWPSPRTLRRELERRMH
ncbi:hypothetical protein AB0M54_02300 [Actinoplanes sp. NPDC051470]|uniref:hypothetical protein n=1 Tax=unclassified Actinoplanes TaxID=2626549 RepID=UPI003427CE6A